MIKLQRSKVVARMVRLAFNKVRKSTISTWNDIHTIPKASMNFLYSVQLSGEIELSLTLP